MNRRAPRSITSARPEPLGKSASQQAYGRRGRARLTHPAHRASTPERTFDVLRRPDIFTCPRHAMQKCGVLAEDFTRKMEDFTRKMEADVPRTSKGKHRTEVVPAVGILGLSLS